MWACAPIGVSLLSNWPNVLEVFKNAPNTLINGNRVYVPEDRGPNLDHYPDRPYARICRS